MRRCLLLVTVLLASAGLAPAQCVTSPLAEGSVPVIDGSGDACPGRLWARAEYLLWWTRGAPLSVPLVSTSGVGDFGVLGASTTRLLIGNETLNFPTRNGGRFTVGGWLDDGQCVGVEGSFLFLGQTTVRRAAAVDGLASQVISIPFIDRTPGGNFGDPSSVGHENAFVFGAPVGVVTATGFGGIAAVSVQDQLWSSEINGLFNVARGDSMRVDVLGGFRYVYFREKLGLATSSPTVVPSIPGEFFVTQDSFDGRNDFYGGQVGARVTWCSGRLSVAATGKVALGLMREQLTVNGAFATNDFNTPFGTGPGRVFPGGYFALPSNMGHYERNRFGVVPELGLNLGYQLTQALSLSVGYTFLYLSSVVRPGDQIDRNINGGQSALYASTPTPPGLQGGPARPAPLFQGSSFWAQGLTFGVELRF